jgi:hypothetical protein
VRKWLGALPAERAVAAGGTVVRLLAGDGLVVAWLEALEGLRVVEGAELAEAPPVAAGLANVVIAGLATRETAWALKPPWGTTWRSNCAPTPTTTKTSRSQASRRL